VRAKGNTTTPARRRTPAAGPGKSGMLLPEQLSRTSRNLTARFGIGSPHTGVGTLSHQRLVNHSLVWGHTEYALIELELLDHLALGVIYGNFQNISLFLATRYGFAYLQ
jgi:hypothetical protein